LGLNLLNDSIKKLDYKDTVNLPKTNFTMGANAIANNLSEVKIEVEDFCLLNLG
jgi:hypothetical protein